MDHFTRLREKRKTKESPSATNHNSTSPSRKITSDNAPLIKKATTMLTPSASSLAANVAFSSVDRKPLPPTGFGGGDSVRIPTKESVIPDSDPSTSQNSQVPGSDMLPRNVNLQEDNQKVPQGVTVVHELEDKPAVEKPTERRRGPLRLLLSGGQQKPDTTVAEMDATSRRLTHKQEEISEMDANQQQTRVHTEADMGRSASGTINTAADELTRLETTIREAFNQFWRPREVNSEIRRSGLATTLEILLEHFKPALKAERILIIIEQKLISAEHAIPMEVLRHAQTSGGAEAMLTKILDDYQLRTDASQAAMERLGEQIRKASPQDAFKNVNAALKSAGVESALDVLVGAHKNIEKELDEEINAVERELKRAARETSWDENVEQILRQSGPDRAVRLLAEHLRATTKALGTKELQLNELDRRWQKLNDDSDRLKQEQSRHEKSVDALHATHQKKVADLTASWKGTLEKQKKEAADQVQEIEQRHRDEMERRESSHRKEIATWNATVAAVKEQHKDQLKDLEATMKKLEQDYQAKVNHIQEDFETREKDSRNREMERIEQLRQDAEALKGALVAREHLKGLSDPEIWERYKRLTGEVDNFSRIQWDKKRESSWPVQDNALRRSENVRKLKQHIVQSTIWMILKKRVFHSPFEILGDEGKRMHREWTSQYGEDRGSELPHWPEATEKSERWRCERVKESTDILNKTDSDAFRTLKTMYESSLTAAVEDIRTAVEAISAVSQPDLQTIREFVSMAATFWLEVTSQIFRVYLVFPAQGASALLSRKSASVTLDLVIQPEVRRIGNAQGQGFIKAQVVKGCEGGQTRF